MEVLAGIIFILMYVVIVSEKIHRTVAAMLGATIMVLIGIMDQETALHHVDFNTLGLLVGMMVLVGVTSHTGLFDYVAIKAAKVAKAEPKRILVYLGLITAIFSAPTKVFGQQIHSLYKISDLPDYRSYTASECKLCKEHIPIDAICNSFGYSVLH